MKDIKEYNCLFRCSIFAWTVQRKRTTVENCWKNSTRKRRNTSCSCCRRAPVVSAWTCRPPTLSSFSIPIGILIKICRPRIVPIVSVRPMKSASCVWWRSDPSKSVFLLLLGIFPVYWFPTLTIPNKMKRKIPPPYTKYRCDTERNILDFKTIHFERTMIDWVWLYLDTNWTWTKRSFRLVCSIKNLPELNDSNSWRPFCTRWVNIFIYNRSSVAVVMSSNIERNEMFDLNMFS